MESVRPTLRALTKERIRRMGDIVNEMDDLFGGGHGRRVV
jgi:hypothetical protein